MPADNLPTLKHLYRGPVNWKHIYKGSIGFWVGRKFDFIEGNYKDKGNEFEGKWQLEQDLDPYNQLVYTIEWKLWDLSPTAKDTDGTQIYTGKVRFIITGKIEQNYGTTTVLGPQKLFEKEENESVLHKIYRKVTMRDREERIKGMAIKTMHEYLNFLKNECGMEMRIV